MKVSAHLYWRYRDYKLTKFKCPEQQTRMHNSLAKTMDSLQNRAINDSYRDKLSKARQLKSATPLQAVAIYKRCLFLREDVEVVVELAECYRQLNDISTALNLYRRAEQILPNWSGKIKQLSLEKGFHTILSGSAKNLLADTQVPEFAEPYLRFKDYLLQSEPTQQIFRSLCFLEVDCRVYAKQELQKVYELNSLLLLCYINLSLHNKGVAFRLFWQAFDIDQSNPHIQEVNQILVSQISSLYKQTQYHLIEGKLDKCSVNIKRGLQMDPYNVDFLVLKAYIHRTKGQFEQALEDLQKAFDHSKGDTGKQQLSNQMALVYNEIGRKLYQSESLDEAVQLFTKAITSKPEDWGARVNRGDCYKITGQFTKSISDYVGAFQIKPSGQISQRIGTVLNSRGISYFNCGDYNQAITDFGSALKQSINPRFHFNRGRAYLQTGQFAQAIRDFQSVLMLEPTNQEALSYIIQHRKK